MSEIISLETLRCKLNVKRLLCGCRRVHSLEGNVAVRKSIEKLLNFPLLHGADDDDDPIKENVRCERWKNENSS